MHILCNGASWVVLVFIQKLVICVFMYNKFLCTIPLLCTTSRNKEVPSQPWHCWPFLCRMRSFRPSPSGVRGAFQVWLRKSVKKKKALLFYTIRSVFSKHGSSAKHLFETKLDDVRSFAVSHNRVQAISLQIGVFMLPWHLQRLFPPFPLLLAIIRRANKTLLRVYRYLVLLSL